MLAASAPELLIAKISFSNGRSLWGQLLGQKAAPYELTSAGRKSLL
jgi:hypothetical protein